MTDEVLDRNLRGLLAAWARERPKPGEGARRALRRAFLERFDARRAARRRRLRVAAAAAVVAVAGAAVAVVAGGPPEDGRDPVAATAVRVRVDGGPWRDHDPARVLEIARAADVEVGAATARLRAGGDRIEVGPDARARLARAEGGWTLDLAAGSAEVAADEPLRLAPEVWALGRVRAVRGPRPAATAALGLPRAFASVPGLLVAVREGRAWSDGLELGPGEAALLHEGRLVWHSAERGAAAGPRTAVSGGPPPEAPPEPTLSGRVFDAETGRPVSDFHVAILEERGVPEPAFPVGRSFADGDGRFEWRGLNPIAHRVLVDAPGYAVWRADGVDPVAGAELAVALERGGAVRGVVTDAATGEPVAGAEVVAEADLPYGLLPMMTLGADALHAARAVTDPEGRYELPNVRAGPQLLRAFRAGHGCGWSAPFTVVPGAVESVDVALPPAARIVGRVADDEGRPVVGGRVVATFVAAQRPAMSFGTALTDAEGAYAVEDLAPGSYALVNLGPTGTGPFRIDQVDVRAGETLRHDFAPAHDRVTVFGVVRTPEGAALPRVSVSFVPEATEDWEEPRFRSATTDGEGRFSLALPEDAYGVWVSWQVAEDLTFAGRIEVGPGTGQRFDVVVGDGRVGGSLTHAATGEPLTTGVVLLEAVGGPPGGLRAKALVGADGGWELFGLPAGTYRAVAAEPGGDRAWVERTVVVAGGGRAQVDFALPRGRTLALTVRDSAGRPVPGARVEVLRDDGSAVGAAPEGRTDGLGRARLSGLPGGLVRVRVRAAGHREAHGAATFVDEAELALELRVEPLGD